VRAVARVFETPCRDCPLRPLKLFHEPTGDELELVQSSSGANSAWARARSLIHEGQTDAPLYTLLQGWAFRYKTLSDGRRQILSFLLAGDFIGVQQKMGDAAAHGVETLTDALFCVFQRDALWELHRRSPMMGFNVTWLTAHEESMVDDTLLSVGRRSAEERIASMLILLFKRAARCRPTRARRGGVPADAAAHRRRAGAVAGAHQQDAAQARAPRPAPHCRRPPAPA
jgi:CRP-like cAMP-binding protein